ncbi:MAG TPA: OB-fold domain-containing protein [Acidimicrobiales bacterium]
MTDVEEFPRFEPPMSDAARPFWEATREPRLVVQWCADCDRPIHYPRDACPQCLGDHLEFRPASGRGSVYAISVMPKAAYPKLADRVPYAVVLVDLDLDGGQSVRFFSNLVADDPTSVPIGTAVEVTWEPLSDGRHLPLFAPIAGA